MTDLRTALGEAVGSAFAEAGLAPSFGRVTPSDRPDLADFQCNGALAAAKSAGRKPREIAEAVAARLAGDPRLASVELAGPGFINLRVADAALAARASEIALDERSGAGVVDAPRRVLVDYGGPNVAKEMHVGHLRASIIGEAVKRLYRFRGDEVLGDAHFGDWGFQMGLLITAVLDEDPPLADLLARFEADPSDANREAALADVSAAITLDDLDRLYPAAAERAEAGGGLPRPGAPGDRRAAGRPRRLPAAVVALRDSDAARRCSATSTRWASISTSGRARATSTT